jgi:hypothetical protein
VVEQGGSAVTGYAVGDQVFGAVPAMSAAVGPGACAELIMVQAQSLAHLPASVDVREAGAAPWAASPPGRPRRPRPGPGRDRLDQADQALQALTAQHTQGKLAIAVGRSPDRSTEPAAGVGHQPLGGGAAI